MSLKYLSLFLPLLGCTQAAIKWGPDKEVSFYRVWTDVAITVGADGSVSYSSNPNDALQGQVIAALIAALKAKNEPPPQQLQDQGDY